MPASILIIEDNPTNLDLIVYLLTKFGHLICHIVDGMEGVLMARQDPSNLILCDIQLPGISGFKVARLLKADAAMRFVPLIAVTALAMVGDRSRIIEAGFDGYIPKPIEPQGLIEELDRYLRPDQRSVHPQARQEGASLHPG